MEEILNFQKPSEGVELVILLHTRCGRVMAKNIAYAKFRKSLLI